MPELFHRPYCLKLEVVKGCNLRCPFCAMPNMPWKNDKYKFMDIKLFKKLMEDFATWLPKVIIEIDERGEPTLHPRLDALMMIARETIPKAQMSFEEKI